MALGYGLRGGGEGEGGGGGGGGGFGVWTKGFGVRTKDRTQRSGVRQNVERSKAE